MQPRIMITDGGPHPADKWADVTTEALMALIEIDEKSNSPEITQARIAKRMLAANLFAVLMEGHQHAQTHERSKIAADGMKRCKAKLDPSAHAGPACSSLQEVFGASPFADHFAKPEVWTIVERIVGQHFANSMHIERRWHEDRTAAAGKGA